MECESGRPPLPTAHTEQHANRICKNTIALANQPCEQASLLKLIGNFIRFSTIEVLCEASVLSEKVGLSQETLSKFVELLIPGPAAGQLKMLNSGAYHKVENVSLRPAPSISLLTMECSPRFRSAWLSRKTRI